MFFFIFELKFPYVYLILLLDEIFIFLICSHFGRSYISMVNAPMASSYPSSSTMQLNTNPSSLGYLSAPISSGDVTMTFHEQPTREISDSWLTLNGSNQVNSFGSNPFNVLESTEPFLEPMQQYMIESELYRMIYGDRGGASGSNGGQENSDDGGSSNCGGTGNGNDISG